MRRRTALGACVGMAAGLGILTGAVGAQNALADLGVAEATARREIVRTLTGGYVNVYQATKAFKAASPAVRVTLVKGAIAWAKAYTESTAFKADYEKQRVADVPQSPQSKGTVDDEIAKQRAERKKSLEDAKKNVEKMPANMRPQMEASIKQMEQQFAKMDTDPQMVAMVRQGIEMQRANDQKTYEQQVQAHDKRFPANPNVLIARRLQEFLATTKDVDFTAKLVPAGAKQRFADPRLEEKPTEWKLCYRAGKDVVAAARDAAQAWLTAIPTK